MNRDTKAAWSYHNATKHSQARLQASRHYLDWEIKPLAFKIYPNLEPIPLPRELPQSAGSALAALLRGTVVPADGTMVPDLAGLARLLYFSAGITRKRVYGDGQEYFFRAAPCTGALYHVDIYVNCGDLPGLSAGVYHFGPHDFSLYRLRSGDHRGVLVAATAAESSMQHAAVALVLASTYWRNSWKYQARAYRHCFWDSGTMLANLLAVAAAAGLPARVVCGFVDDAVSGLLGLDREREGPLALVSLGRAGAVTPPAAPIAQAVHATLPLSSRSLDYPAIREMQAASELSDPEAVRIWRSQPSHPVAKPRPQGEIIPLRPLETALWPGESLDSVITRRGSTRRFAPRSISFAELSTILDAASPEITGDFGEVRPDIYLIVNAVDGLATGTYVHHADARALERLRAGDFRSEAGFLGLGQDLPADASVNLYFLCALDPVLERLGNRGYRVAQLGAAIAGGRAYLAAYALRLGATGLTFFDDDVTAFFSPHAAGKSVMFLVAVGHAARALRATR
jgi:SagB-type dehydrogenase family enzyme